MEQMRWSEDGSLSICFSGLLASPLSVAARFPGNYLLELRQGKQDEWEEDLCRRQEQRRGGSHSSRVMGETGK